MGGPRAVTERFAFAAVVALATSAATAAGASAQAADAGDRPRLEQAGLHFSVFRQEGRGVQSQASPDAAQRGSIASASYSFTAQFGHLETTYNSVPLQGGGRTGDLFPRSRGRHTLSGQLRQAILETQTFLALSYRFYADSFLATAHTAQLTATQLFGDLWFRAHYRFHVQESPSFWMAVAPTDIQISPTGPHGPPTPTWRISTHKSLASTRAGSSSARER